MSERSQITYMQMMGNPETFAAILLPVLPAPAQRSMLLP